MSKKKNYSPQNPYYHDTLKLLKSYREVLWHIEVANSDFQAECRAMYGDYLPDVISSAPEIYDLQLNSYTETVERSRKMLEILNNAVQMLRKRHLKGEVYYWILFYSYLSPQIYETAYDVLAVLDGRHFVMSLRTFYVRRAEAIDLLSGILWGYTTKECRDSLELFEKR